VGHSKTGTAYPHPQARDSPAREFVRKLTSAHCVHGVGRKNANADQCEQRDNDIHDATFLLTTG